jgi:hypothetical protein
VQVKEGSEPAIFTSYFQGWRAGEAPKSAADYEKQVAALKAAHSSGSTAKNGRHSAAAADSLDFDLPTAADLPTAGSGRHAITTSKDTVDDVAGKMEEIVLPDDSECAACGTQTLLSYTVPHLMSLQHAGTACGHPQVSSRHQL